MFSTRLGRQASGFLQDKYKQARLALGDVTQAELLVQEATNNEPCVPDAKTLACIADAAFDMDDYWRIANVLQRRLGCVHDWKEWRPVYKALVVLEFLLTHGPDELPRDFLAVDMPALHDLRAFNYTDDKGFDWGASMQRRADSVISLLTDAQRLKDARRRTAAIRHVHDSPTSTSSSSSRSSAWSVDSPTLVCLCAPDAGYRHDKKFDAYTADDDTMDDYPTPQSQGGGGSCSCWFEESSSSSLSGSPMSSSSGSSTRAFGVQSLSQPERRTSKKLQSQQSMNY